jgi:predicted SprT family Zn-dependent metalloprotease
MTPLPADRFAALWAAAATLDAAAAAVGAALGGPVPRWAVAAQAVALRRAGVPLPPLAGEGPPPAARATQALRQTAQLAAKLMTEHGLAGWQFGFNRNVRRAGVCRYPTRGRPGRIELSAHFVARNPEAEVRDTLLHEIAHALVGPGHGHDEVWKAKCVAVGARPERCYGEAVEMPRGRWRAACPGCGREFDRHRRPPRLTGYHCKGCGPDRGPLVWRPAAG